MQPPPHQIRTTTNPVLKTRLIAVLFLMDGKIVQSRGFNEHRIIGDPLHELTRFSEWGVDELVYIDISRKPDFAQTLSILNEIGERAFMPLTFGGNVTKPEQFRDLLATGADKVIVNSAVYEDPLMVVGPAIKHGSQAVVVGIDYRVIEGNPVVYTNQGTVARGLSPSEYAKKVEQLGCGEIFLNSIDKDGTGKGYDLDVITSVAKAVRCPVVACGGVGKAGHFIDGINAGASAVAAGNYFHFTENAYPKTKTELIKAGIPMRPKEDVPIR